MKKNKTKEERLNVVSAPQGQTASMSIFKKKEDVDTSGFEIKSRSPMLKPGQFPIGMQLVGVLKRLITCTAQKANGKTPAKMGNMLEIVPEGAQVGVALPVTTVLKSALEIEGEGDEAECPYIGRTIIIERLEEKIPSARGQAAWNFIVAIGPEE